jgi:F0F1-type ATP synthase assembly protein I
MSEIVNSAGSGAFADHDGAALERRLLRGMCVSLMLAVTISLPLDCWLKTTPWLLVGGIVLGSVVGLYQFIRMTFPHGLKSFYSSIRLQKKRPSARKSQGIPLLIFVRQWAKLNY